MNKRTWILGALALTGIVFACDPYMAANTDSPQVWGVVVADTAYMGQQVVPPNVDGCTAPYPQPSQSWADATYPGLCAPDNLAIGYPTVCPVLCFPPRMGPAFAPFFTGNLGGSYQTAANTTYTYTMLNAYVLPNVPSGPVGADEFVFGQIRVVFNKLLNPASVQPDPTKPVASSNLVITTVSPAATPGDGTPINPDEYEVTYFPNSGPMYLGASIAIMPVTGQLAADTKYTIKGTVTDQQGNPATINVVVTTAP
jgi:hypothetical protein